VGAVTLPPEMPAHDAWLALARQRVAQAPVVNAQGVPMRPYIRTTPTCAPYGRCTGLGSCPNGYCNLCDTAGNCFCAQVCTSDAMCGGAQCTTYSRSIGSCPNTQRACAPR